jgi:hypothetical protein
VFVCEFEAIALDVSLQLIKLSSILICVALPTHDLLVQSRLTTFSNFLNGRDMKLLSMLVCVAVTAHGLLVLSRLTTSSNFLNGRDMKLLSMLVCVAVTAHGLLGQSRLTTSSNFLNGRESYCAYMWPRASQGFVLLCALRLHLFGKWRLKMFSVGVVVYSFELFAQFSDLYKDYGDKLHAHWERR